MKVFEVVFETDGHTVKAPGVSETTIRRENTYFAAESAERVWEEIAERRADPNFTFIMLAEIMPMITVLPTGPQHREQHD